MTVKAIFLSLLAVGLAFGQGTGGVTSYPPPAGNPGTVTSVAAGCGLIGTTITSAGTLSGAGPCPSTSVAGTADAITAVYSPVRTSLFTGEMLSFTPTAPNATTTPTFSPDGLTAHTIVKAGATALAAGDIATGVAALLKYDATGTRWELQNPQTGSGSGGGGFQISTAFCASGTCSNDVTTNAKPVILASGTVTLNKCYAVWYGVIPSSTITLDIRKNSTTSANGTDLLGSAWSFSTATLGTPLLFGGSFAATTLTSGDQAAIYFTGATGQGLTVTCAAS